VKKQGIPAIPGPLESRGKILDLPLFFTFPLVVARHAASIKILVAYCIN
jgi:hypothetical protein